MLNDTAQPGASQAVRRVSCLLGSGRSPPSGYGVSRCVPLKVREVHLDYRLFLRQPQRCHAVGRRLADSHECASTRPSCPCHLVIAVAGGALSFHKVGVSSRWFFKQSCRPSDRGAGRYGRALLNTRSQTNTGSGSGRGADQEFSLRVVSVGRTCRCPHQGAPAAVGAAPTSCN